MDARPDDTTPAALERLEGEPAFELTPAEPALSPLVFASPHSGRLYPEEMMAASHLEGAAIRRSEDAYVDELIGPATVLGVPMIAARYARAYVDVNREPYELDPAMFEDELPAFAAARTARVAAGLGSIARVVAEGQEIYHRKLTFGEAKRRIDRIHRPYHAALKGLIDSAKTRWGSAVLIDWHSMPSAAAGGSRAGAPDVVLGDRFGASCARSVTDAWDRALSAEGLKVARNAPYAGGYTTQFYGAPATGVHALQIEINRALYLDESNLERRPGFEALRQALRRATVQVMNTDRSRLG